MGLLSSCKEEDPSTNRISAELLTTNAKDQLVYHDKELFTGTAVVFYPNQLAAETTEYIDGKKNGAYKLYFADGKLSFESNYKNDLQDGTGKSWWKDGKLRSESHYKNGVVEGTQKQWYRSGRIFKELNIKEGKEVGMQKAWRENGKIYNNYEAKDGRIFGLKRATLCYDLEEEIIQDY